MEAEKLAHYRQILLKELRRHNQNVREDQAAALESADDGVKDAVDMSLEDVNKEVAFRLGERESQLVADIDQALLRIDEGSYGTCARCEQEINERRLDAMPPHATAPGVNH
ncbi:MAG: TraR/DksA C4-type zinc finger protein [Pyrinomonadaceae bacterium]